MHSYKIGRNANAKDMTDDEALQYAELHNIGADTTADAQLVGEASAGALAEADADAEGEAEKEPTPPPKTPKTKASGRKPKASKGTPAETVIAPAPTSAIVPEAKVAPAAAPKEKKETPATSNKRKRAKKGDEPAAETEELAVETPKSGAKPRKKKTKADA